MSRPGDSDPQTPVLGQPALRDVHLGQNLDPGDDRRMHPLGRRHDLAQHAVHPDAHDGRFGLRLDVHVAGAVLDRLPQQQIDEADDGRLVGRFLAAGLSIETLLHGDALGRLLLGVVLGCDQVAKLPLLDIRAVVDHLDRPADLPGGADRRA